VPGPGDFSSQALVESEECVIAIHGGDLMEKTVDIGNCSGAAIDKCHAFRLDGLPAENVEAPLIRPCLDYINRKVDDKQLAEQYNLVVVAAVKAWTNGASSEQRIFHHKGDGTFSVAGRTRDLKVRMTKWKALTE